MGLEGDVIMSLKSEAEWPICSADIIRTEFLNKYYKKKVTLHFAHLTSFSQNKLITRVKKDASGRVNNYWTFRFWVSYPFTRDQRLKSRVLIESTISRCTGRQSRKQLKWQNEEQTDASRALQTNTRTFVFSISAEGDGEMRLIHGQVDVKPFHRS